MIPTENTPLKARGLASTDDEDRAEKKRLFRWRTFVFATTFFAYAMSHFSRKSYVCSHLAFPFSPV
jgi:hypothetical protein